MRREILRAMTISDPLARPTPAPVAMPDATAFRLAPWVAIVTLSWFGPYLAGGVRTEQAVVYPSAAFALWFGTRRRRSVRSGALVLWWVLVCAIVLAPHPSLNGMYYSGRYLAGLDNYAGPLATLTLAVMWVRAYYPPRVILDTVCVVLVACCGLNGLLAVAQLSFDMTPYLSYWWPPAAFDPGTGLTFSGPLDALALGRATGIFEQVAEGGNAYTCGLFAAIYLGGRLPRGWRWFAGLGGALTTIAGLIAASKAFILVGPLVGAWQFSREPYALHRWVKVGAVSLGACLMAVAVGARWRSAFLITDLAHSHDSLLLTVTNGRLGGDNQSSRLWSYVWSTSRLFGYGPAGILGPYDSAWLEAMVVGGLIGILLVVVTLGYIGFRLFDGWSSRPREVSAFAAAVFVSALINSVGLPVFTANRVGSALWMLLAVAVLSCWDEESTLEPGRRGSRYSP
ncbi:MAG: hypothetical protein ACQSGP_07150 [Frankia sp.]